MAVRVKSMPIAQTVGDLMKTPEGVAWWTEHGVSFRGKFDLSEGSESLKTWEAYVERTKDRHKPK